MAKFSGEVVAESKHTSIFCGGDGKVVVVFGFKVRISIFCSKRSITGDLRSQACILHRKSIFTLAFIITVLGAICFCAEKRTAISCLI